MMIFVKLYLEFFRDVDLVPSCHGAEHRCRSTFSKPLVSTGWSYMMLQDVANSLTSEKSWFETQSRNHLQILRKSEPQHDWKAVSWVQKYCAVKSRMPTNFFCNNSPKDLLKVGLRWTEFEAKSTLSRIHHNPSTGFHKISPDLNIQCGYWKSWSLESWGLFGRPKLCTCEPAVGICRTAPRCESLRNFCIDHKHGILNRSIIRSISS